MKESTSIGRKLMAVFMIALMLGSAFALMGAALIPDEDISLLDSEPLNDIGPEENEETMDRTEPASETHDVPTVTAVSGAAKTYQDDDEQVWFDEPNNHEKAQSMAAEWEEQKALERNAAEDEGRIYVVSDETHVAIALGTNATGYKRFPVADPNGTDGLKSGQAIDITGQLVDGHQSNITPIHAGGLGNNHGIGGDGPGQTLSVSWNLKDETGTTLLNGNVLVDWNDGIPGNTAINGTFRLIGIVPDLSPAGLATFTFCFSGYQGNPPPPQGGNIYPPNGDPPGSCDKYPVYIQHEVFPVIQVTPDPANAGEPVTISGSLKDDDGYAVPNEGLVISYENPKGIYTTIGADLPSGLFVDDVTVTGTGSPVFTDDFEEGFEVQGWSHGGLLDEWEVGIPAYGPTSAHSPINCAGTDLDDSYEIQTDSFLTSPTLNLSGKSGIILSFWYWLDIDTNDMVWIEATADGGMRWVSLTSQPITTSTNVWDSQTIPMSEIQDPKDPTKTIKFEGSESVKFRFRIESKGYSIYTDTDGEFSFSYLIPPESIPARHNVKVEHPKTQLFLKADNNVSIRVRRVTHFEYLTDNSTKVGYRSKWVEIRAKLVDNMGEVPLNNIDGLPQAYMVRIFWDPTFNDPSDNPIPVDQKTITLGSANESRNGWVVVSYLVPLSQDLGHVKVIFKFDGTDYYKTCNEEDVYAVKAHTQINAPPPEQLRFYRGSHINLQGSLVIIPSESQVNPTGDPVPFRDVRIYWEAKELTKATTDLQGRFSREFFVGESHSLGHVEVRFVFDGDFPYEPVDSSFNMSVVSRTYIEFLSKTNFREYKGQTIEIRGQIADDLGTAIPELPIIIKKIQRGSEKTLGRATSGIDGTFSLKYKIPYEDRVGNLTISAQFDGTDKYEPSQNITNYTIVVKTTIVRMDSTFDVVRGEQMTIYGFLYENWEGSLGYFVPFEPVTINLGRVPLTTVLTDIEGNFSVRSFVPDQIDVGPADVDLDYNGSLFYDGCQNTTTIYVRSHTLLTFEDVHPNFTLWRDTRLTGNILLTDDLDNPLKNETVKIFWVKEGEDPEAVSTDRQREIEHNRTDSGGRVFFNITFHDGIQTDDVQVEPRYLYASYDGRFIDTTFGKPTDILISSNANHTLEYKIQAKPPVERFIWIIVLIVVAIICIVVGYLFYEMNKRRALRGMQTIIRKAADQLVAGNEYAAVIFKAYRKLAANMKRYGYMRRDSETFREFEDAIRQALPIDQHAMDDFIDVLEEARYSSHEMGEPDRDRAIEALRRVQFSLEKVVLTDEQMRSIQARATELSIADDVEPVIVVDKGTTLKRGAGTGAVPPKPGGPPKGGPPPKPSGPPSERPPSPPKPDKPGGDDLIKE